MTDDGWSRLDKRMLLVHPVTEIVRFVPVLLVSLFVGVSNDNPMWTLGATAVIVVFALLRWVTTTYRIGPERIELRTGVVQRKVLSVPRSRIRSIDIDANLLHRLLGLAVVRVGTGTAEGDEKFELNALDARLVPGLRAELLTGAAEPAPVSQPSNLIARFDPSWVRYAPLSGTGIASVAAAIGVLFQMGLGERIARSAQMSSWVDRIEDLGIVAAVLLGVVAFVVVVSVVACVFYALNYGGLEIVDDGKALHTKRGLLNTRETSLDRARLRGATLKEPLLLRLARGAKLDAIMTGVGATEKRESALLLPQAPAAEVLRVLDAVIGSTAQATVRLVPHGPAARRRRYVRAVVPVLVVIAGTVWWATPLVWAAYVVALLAAVALAWDRYRSLGHAVLPGWLVTRSGSLDRDRDCVQSAGIIAWTVRQTFFQRRAGVATVVAATAAGKGHYEVVDIPFAQAWALAEAVAPGAGDRWAVPAS